MVELDTLATRCSSVLETQGCDIASPVGGALQPAQTNTSVAPVGGALQPAQTNTSVAQDSGIENSLAVFASKCKSAEFRLMYPFVPEMMLHCRQPGFVPHQCARHLASPP